MKIKSHYVLLLVAAITCIASPAGAQAEYPTKPLRLIVPFSAGGPSDVLARAIGQKLSESLRQTVVVENRTGAGGNIASDFVAKAPPDGYTLVLANVGTHAINQSLYAKLPFDTLRDFTPIALIASASIVMVAHPSVPAASVKEFVALAKSQPLSYASAGNGTPQHLAGELFKMLTGAALVHIPYKGGSPALNDLLGGQVSAAFVSLPAAISFIQAGKLRAFGVTTAKRSEAAPELPTLAEAGVPGFEVDNWYGVLAPAGTPSNVVTRLNSEIVKLMHTPEMRKRLGVQGFEVLRSTPEEFAAFNKTEVVKWAKVIKLSGAKAD